MEVTTPLQYEERSRKRQKRAGRPCDACRRRKTRCISGADDDQCCLHCQLKQTSCTFRLNPPRRQAMTQGTVIGSSVPPSTDTAPVQPPGVPNGPSPTTTIPALSRGHYGNDPQSDVSLGQNTLGHASPADTSLGLAPSRFAELYGLGSDMEPILMKYRPYDSSTHEFCLETHAIRRVLDKDDGQEYPLTFHVAADEKALEADADLSQVTAIENCVTPMDQPFWTCFGDTCSRAIPSYQRMSSCKYTSVLSSVSQPRF
uniref:Zn(2)-C6 fungal-type domain-containing protein n=1 Tax=Bionectria ochroleuca TaxID=29856 RepID=A0A8H7NH47_BIOOC